MFKFVYSRIYAAICRISNLVDKLTLFLYAVCFDEARHLHYPSVFLTCYLVCPSVVLRHDIIDLTSRDKKWLKVRLSPMSSALVFLCWYYSLQFHNPTCLKVRFLLFVFFSCFLSF